MRTNEKVAIATLVASIALLVTSVVVVAEAVIFDEPVKEPTVVEVAATRAPLKYALTGEKAAVKKLRTSIEKREVEEYERAECRAVDYRERGAGGSGASGKASEVNSGGANGSYTLTFYCPCERCSEGWGRSTASGAKARAGRTVAAPTGLAFGTRLDIEGFGVRVVEDRGGAIKGNILDVFVESHEEALKLGRIKGVKVRVLK